MIGNDIIEEEIRKVREAALQRSRERTLPTLPLKNKVLSEQEWLQSLNKREQDIKKHPISPMIDKMRLEGVNNERKAGYQNYLGSNCLGPTCAATAANNYGLDFVGSQQFRDNYQKYGFKKIDNSEVQPGDIVIDVVNRVGSHTMMLDNKDKGLRFNHSNGGWYAQNIRKNAKYPFKGEMESYTFVGTPSDSIRWTKQYQGGGSVQKILTGMIPIYGTYQDAKEFINNPTLENFGWTVASGLGDVFFFTGLGAGIKGLKVANAARKAKSILKTKRANKLLDARRNYQNTKLGIIDGSSTRKEMKQALQSLGASVDNFRNMERKYNLATRAYNQEMKALGVKSTKEIGKDGIIQTTQYITE